MTAVVEQLSLANLDLPRKPEVREIRASDYIDSIGDPAIRVVVVVAPGERHGEYSWEELRAIRDAIVQKVRENGDPRFAYVSFLSEDEL